MQYTSTDNKTYEKSTLDLSDYSDMLSSVQTTDMYSDLKIVKNSVTVNGKSTVQIQAQLKGEDIAGLLAQLGLNGDNTQGTSSDYRSLSPITISLWIDKKTYYPVKQTIDMKDFMNEYLSSLVADSDMSYSKIKTSVTYKNFNKATKFFTSESLQINERNEKSWNNDRFVIPTFLLSLCTIRCINCNDKHQCRNLIFGI